MRAGTLTADGRLLFLTRTIRLFGYGMISVVLVLYLVRLGLTGSEIAWLLALTLLGDALVSVLLSARADRAGRRRTLVAGAALMTAAGVAFAFTRNYWLLLLAATIGVISPSGNEVGPFLSVEQASLSHVVSRDDRTRVFAWYHLAGSVAGAAGALAGGLLVGSLQHAGWEATDAFRAAIVVYACLGFILAVTFLGLTPAVESQSSTTTTLFGLHRSKSVVFRLSSLFALDAFGGGFVVQSVAAYWFHARFGLTPAGLGGLFFGTNLLAGLSALVTVPLARRLGLIATMVFTHIPSNVLLILVPFMPTAESAMAVFLLRFSISQMDVPTRQSYVMAVVDADERSAAAGVTGVARTAGAAFSPGLSTMLLAVPGLMAAPFVLSGALKIIYDLLLWRAFRSVSEEPRPSPLNPQKTRTIEP